jgi:hypothetical protein
MQLNNNRIYLDGNGYDWIYLYSETSNPIKLIEENGSVPFIGHGKYIATKKGCKYELDTSYADTITKTNNKIKKSTKKVSELINNKFELKNLTNNNKSKIKEYIDSKMYKELLEYVNKNNLGSYNLCCNYKLIIDEFNKKV